MKLLSQMTEEELKTLCNSIKNEYANNSSVTLKQSDFDNMWKTIDKQTEQINRLQQQVDDATTTIISLYNMGVKNNIPEVMSLVLDYVRKYGTTEETSVNNI